MEKRLTKKIMAHTSPTPERSEVRQLNRESGLNFGNKVPEREDRSTSRQFRPIETELQQKKNSSYLYQVLQPELSDRHAKVFHHTVRRNQTQEKLVQGWGTHKVADRSSELNSMSSMKPVKKVDPNRNNSVNPMNPSQGAKELNERLLRARVQTAPKDNGMGSILSYSSALPYRDDSRGTNRISGKPMTRTAY